MPIGENAKLMGKALVRGFWPSTPEFESGKATKAIKALELGKEFHGRVIEHSQLARDLMRGYGWDKETHPADDLGGERPARWEKYMENLPAGDFLFFVSKWVLEEVSIDPKNHRWFLHDLREFHEFWGKEGMNYIKRKFHKKGIHGELVGSRCQLFGLGLLYQLCEEPETWCHTKFQRSLKVNRPGIEAEAREKFAIEEEREDFASPVTIFLTNEKDICLPLFDRWLFFSQIAEEKTLFKVLRALIMYQFNPKSINFEDPHMEKAFQTMPDLREVMLSWVDKRGGNKKAVLILQDFFDGWEWIPAPMRRNITAIPKDSVEIEQKLRDKAAAVRAATELATEPEPEPEPPEPEPAPEPEPEIPKPRLDWSDAIRQEVKESILEGRPFEIPLQNITDEHQPKVCFTVDQNHHKREQFYASDNGHSSITCNQDNALTCERLPGNYRVTANLVVGAETFNGASLNFQIPFEAPSIITGQAELASQWNDPFVAEMQVRVANAPTIEKPQVALHLTRGEKTPEPAVFDIDEGGIIKIRKDKLIWLDPDDDTPLEVEFSYMGLTPMVGAPLSQTLTFDYDPTQVQEHIAAPDISNLDSLKETLDSSDNFGGDFPIQLQKPLPEYIDDTWELSGGITPMNEPDTYLDDATFTESIDLTAGIAMVDIDALKPTKPGLYYFMLEFVHPQYKFCKGVGRQRIGFVVAPELMPKTPDPWADNVNQSLVTADPEVTQSVIDVSSYNPENGEIMLAFPSPLNEEIGMDYATITGVQDDQAETGQIIPEGAVAPYDCLCGLGNAVITRQLQKEANASATKIFDISDPNFAEVVSYPQGFENDDKSVWGWFRDKTVYWDLTAELFSRVMCQRINAAGDVIVACEKHPTFNRLGRVMLMGEFRSIGFEIQVDFTKEGYRSVSLTPEGIGLNQQAAINRYLTGLLYRLNEMAHQCHQTELLWNEVDPLIGTETLETSEYEKLVRRFFEARPDGSPNPVTVREPGIDPTQRITHQTTIDQLRVQRTEVEEALIVLAESGEMTPDILDLIITYHQNCVVLRRHKLQASNADFDENSEDAIRAIQADPKQRQIWLERFCATFNLPGSGGRDPYILRSDHEKGKKIRSKALAAVQGYFISGVENGGVDDLEAPEPTMPPEPSGVLREFLTPDFLRGLEAYFAEHDLYEGDANTDELRGRVLVTMNLPDDRAKRDKMSERLTGNALTRFHEFVLQQEFYQQMMDIDGSFVDQMGDHFIARSVPFTYVGDIALRTNELFLAEEELFGKGD